MESARKEIHTKGFMGAGLSDILQNTGLTRGALYHHFPNKKALGLAALDLIEQEMRSMWLEPLEQAADPITALQQAMFKVGMEFTPDDLILGCPLNNLAQEMAPQDEDFRGRIVEIYDSWRQGVAAALSRGQEQGLIKPEVDAMAAATFFVAALTGGRGLAKTTQDLGLLAGCAQILGQYLETLRA